MSLDKSNSLKICSTYFCYQDCFLVPNTHADAMELDRINKKTLWHDAEQEEISLLLYYATFNDLVKDGVPPHNSQKI
jgi:hypothetical protein